MIRNYFDDLELDPAASLEDIRQAYRRLARRFHPDLNPGDQYAAESFRRIKEAYDQLSSEESIEKIRRSLDASSSRPKEVSRWDRRIRVYSEVLKTSPRRDEERRNEILDLQLELKLSEADLEKSELELAYEREDICSSCKGSGGDPQSIKTTCKKCAGLGYEHIKRGAFNWKKTCSSCKGQGFQMSSPCLDCEGKGKAMQKMKTKFKLPSSIPAEKKLSGMGNISNDGQTRGDLWVKLIKV